MPKKLGQHFLKNKAAIQKIIASLELKTGETVIEVGPGKGALTIPLIEECRKVGCNFIGIEKDARLANQLMSYASATVNQFEILTGDALKILPDLTEKLKTDNWKLVGNIPYYITGKLLRVLSELNPPAGGKPALTILMIQKEVAERIIAEPPRMNLLSAATQFWAEPKILMNLKSTDFDPAPEVDSAIITLRIKNQELRIMKSKLFSPFIIWATRENGRQKKSITGFLRKTMRKCLKNKANITTL